MEHITPSLARGVRAVSCFAKAKKFKALFASQMPSGEAE